MKSTGEWPWRMTRRHGVIAAGEPRYPLPQNIAYDQVR
jgi:hypothetical protein